MKKLGTSVLYIMFVMLLCPSYLYAVPVNYSLNGWIVFQHDEEESLEEYFTGQMLIEDTSTPNENEASGGYWWHSYQVYHAELKFRWGHYIFTEGELDGSHGFDATTLTLDGDGVSFSTMGNDFVMQDTDIPQVLPDRWWLPIWNISLTPYPLDGYRPYGGATTSFLAERMEVEVPEPSEVISLFLAGLVLLVILKRRAKKVNREFGISS